MIKGGEKEEGYGLENGGKVMCGKMEGLIVGVMGEGIREGKSGRIMSVKRGRSKDGEKGKG